MAGTILFQKKQNKKVPPVEQFCSKNGTILFHKLRDIPTNLYCRFSKNTLQINY